MRENIGLYKAKRKDNGEWVEGYYLFVKEQNKHYILTGKTRSYPIDLAHPHLTLKGFEWLEIDPETLCECTGLKDKNGKLIFEGDIVDKKYDNCNCEVVFGDYSIGHDDWGIEHITQGFALKFNDGSGYCGLSEKNKHEVIGNKFDNKELLGE